MRGPQPILMIGIMAMLVIGFFLIIVLNPLPDSTGTSPLPTRPTSQLNPSANLVTILLTCVDSLQNPHPQLEMSWMVAFQPDSLQYYLVGFAAETVVTRAPDGQTRRLADIYQEDAPLQRGSVFSQSAMRQVVPGLPTAQGEIIIDRQTIRAITNMLDSFTIYGESLRGDSLLARYDTLAPENLTDRLQFQGEAIKNTLLATEQQNWTLTTLLIQYQVNQQFYPDPFTLAALLDKAPPPSQSQFNIQLAPVTIP